VRPSLGSYALVGLVAAIVTWALVPLTQRLAVRLGAVAAPDERRVHRWPTPTLGGAAMLAGLLAAVAVASQLDAFDAMFASASEIVGIVAAAVVMYVVGFIDDLREVSAPAKTAGMVLAGSVLSITGVSLVFFRVPFSGFLVLSADLAALVTVLWVIGMANAVNLIDGLDGLSAGIVGIAAAAFFVYTQQLADNELLRPPNAAPLIAVAVVGMCAGFLPHNFYPARVFMGDGGALLLGLLMAAATISVGGRTRDQFSGQTYFFFAPLVIPLFILGVPIFDTAFAIVRRATRRSGLATADKGHLHHRLMNLGHGQRRSVLILWAWTALLSAVALYPTFTGRGDGLVLLGLAALGLLLFTYFHPGLQRHRAGRS
jgi:UDP-GlcNAc:undecaprenyl-phosphate GlcNAc-1-phosphate transferase